MNERHFDARAQRSKCTKQIFIACFLCALCVSALTHSANAQGVTFIATWQNAYFRSAPSVNAQTLAPLVQGASFIVIGRSEDNQWLALYAPNYAGWLPA